MRIFMTLVLMFTYSHAVIADAPLPKFECDVSFVDGGFFGYGPPATGDRLILNVGQIIGRDIKTIDFIPKGHRAPPYIPIHSPISIAGRTISPKGKLDWLRLESVYRKATKSQAGHRLYLDFRNVPGAGQGLDFYILWIIEEYSSISSVLRAGCQATDNG